MPPFVEDRTHEGRKYRMLNVIAEFTRECLAIRIDRKLNSTAVIDVLSDLLAFAEQQASQIDASRPAHERRASVRLPFAVSAIVQAVDDDLTPLSDPVAAATRDMTADGLGLITNVPLNEGDLFVVRLTINGQDVCLLTEAAWCKPVAPFHFAGVRALKSLNSMP